MAYKAKSQYVSIKGEKKMVKLSKGFAALLTVLRKKSSFAKTTEKICEEAGVEVSTYYRAFRDEGFNKAISQECNAWMMATKLPLIQRMTSEALTNKSHHWAKMVAEMLGVYTPGGKQSNKPVEINFVVNIDRPHAEIKEAITIEAGAS